MMAHLQAPRVAVMLAGMACLVAAGPVTAKPVQVTWSTYLRAAPSNAAGVIDEVQHDVWVDLRRCGQRWCEVASGPVVGFIDKDAIALPRLPAGGAPVFDEKTCFVAGQQAWREPAPTRFCETRPRP